MAERAIARAYSMTQHTHTGLATAKTTKEICCEASRRKKNNKRNMLRTEEVKDKTYETNNKNKQNLFSKNV